MYLHHIHICSSLSLLWSRPDPPCPQPVIKSPQLTIANIRPLKDSTTFSQGSIDNMLDRMGMLGIVSACFKSVPESHKPILSKVVRSSVCPLLKSVSICQSTCRIPAPALGLSIEKCVMASGQLKTGARQIHQEMHIDDRDLIKNGGILEKVVKGELDKIKATTKPNTNRNCLPLTY